MVAHTHTHTYEQISYLEYKTHPNQITRLTILWASKVWVFPRKAGLQSRKRETELIFQKLDVKLLNGEQLKKDSKIYSCSTTYLTRVHAYIPSELFNADQVKYKTYSMTMDDCRSPDFGRAIKIIKYFSKN